MPAHWNLLRAIVRTRECEPCPTITWISYLSLSLDYQRGSRALRILKPSRSISPSLPWYLLPFPSHFVRTLHHTPHLFLSRSHPHDANTLKLIHKTSMYNHLLLSTVCECFSEVSFFYSPLSSFCLSCFLSLFPFLSHPSALVLPHFDEFYLV